MSATETEQTVLLSRGFRPLNIFDPTGSVWRKEFVDASGAIHQLSVVLNAPGYGPRLSTLQLSTQRVIAARDVLGSSADVSQLPDDVRVDAQAVFRIFEVKSP